MAIAFSIGGAISFALFTRDNSKQKFVNPEQFRTPQLKANQSLQPSFDPGVIAGNKPFPVSPNASAAKELEASLGAAVSGKGKAALSSGSAKPKQSKPKQAGENNPGQPAQPPAQQPKPKKPSMSDIRDELM